MARLVPFKLGRGSRLEPFETQHRGRHGRHGRHEHDAHWRQQGVPACLHFVQASISSCRSSGALQNQGARCLWQTSQRVPHYCKVPHKCGTLRLLCGTLQSWRSALPTRELPERMLSPAVAAATRRCCAFDAACEAAAALRVTGIRVE